DGFDHRDAVAPPGRFEAISMYLLPADFEESSTKLAREYRPFTGGGQRFKLVLRSEPGQQLQLDASAKGLPSGWTPLLVKESNGKRFALDEPVGITPQVSGGAYVLLVGPSQFVQQQANQVAPSSSKLVANYPNPFNSQATIVYDVARTAPVQLAVYNVLGRKVATLVDQQQAPGRKQATFQAESLASGVYFFRLQIGQVLETGRLTLIK
ncbi:T9SS type A sorting domain-containing protein, partial [Aliifodinibius sp. S!AR15-10]|uniref:T9SS type A sorting domain-containing protein n=1 Tax=Aliifodinibius sp. S!AR15-10 TaxID=2950437 RepID=UPI00285E6F71